MVLFLIKKNYICLHFYMKLETVSWIPILLFGQLVDDGSEIRFKFHMLKINKEIHCRSRFLKSHSSWIPIKSNSIVTSFLPIWVELYDFAPMISICKFIICPSKTSRLLIYWFSAGILSKLRGHPKRLQRWAPQKQFYHLYPRQFLTFLILNHVWTV